MSKTSDKSGKPQIATPKTASRRRLLSLLTAGGVATTSKLLPEQWSKPVVESLLLPAHAATTDDSGSSPGTTVEMIGPIGDGNPGIRAGMLDTGSSSLASLGEKALDFVIPEAFALRSYTDAFGQCISIKASVENGPVTVEISNIGTQSGTLSGRVFEFTFAHPAGDFMVKGKIFEDFSQAIGSVSDPRDRNNPDFSSCEDSFHAVVGGSCTPGDSSVEQYRYCGGFFVEG